MAKFLDDSGIVYEDLQTSARKLVIYLPTETTREDAPQIANDTMLFLCTGTKNPPGYVKTDDKAGALTPGYHAADHPITHAQSEDICEG